MAEALRVEATAPQSDNDEAVQYLSTFLGRTLRIHTTDARMFVGTMKCTDKDRNIILALTHEYRQPSESAIKAAAAESDSNKLSSVRLPLASRFVGQVVVPGRYITKIEVTKW